MINYPIKRKVQQKTTNYANLGMTLESDIESSNLFYLNSWIAVIHKTPSTTDFNGIFQGYYIDFDAKETNSKTSMPLKNVHEHQIDHLRGVVKQGGIAFLIVHYKAYNEYFLLPASVLFTYWDSKHEEKGRKSIPYEVFKTEAFQVPFGYQPRLDYLKVIKLNLDAFLKNHR